MFLDADKGIAQVQNAISDATERFGHNRYQWLAWPQTWGSTTCGFGGIGGAAMCDAQTVIASGDDDTVLVYHGGRFAYEVKRPTEKFWVECGQRKLPGAVRWPEAAAEYDNLAVPPAPTENKKLKRFIKNRSALSRGK